MKRGFTLLELLLVLGIVSILGVAATALYGGFIRNITIDSASNNILFEVKRARGNAMAGVEGRKWGVRFISTNNSYQVFSTPTTYDSPSTTVDFTNFLPSGVAFIDPASPATKDVIFEKIRGTVPTSVTVTIFNAAAGKTKTLNVNTSGNVYVY